MSVESQSKTQVSLFRLTRGERSDCLEQAHWKLNDWPPGWRGNQEEEEEEEGFTEAHRPSSSFSAQNYFVIQCEAQKSNIIGILNIAKTRRRKRQRKSGKKNSQN